jgi:hypothetical protein
VSGGTEREGITVYIMTPDQPCSALTLAYNLNVLWCYVSGCCGQAVKHGFHSRGFVLPPVVKTTCIA